MKKIICGALNVFFIYDDQNEEYYIRRGVEVIEATVTGNPMEAKNSFIATLEHDLTKRIGDKWEEQGLNRWTGKPTTKKDNLCEPSKSYTDCQ